MMTAPVLVPHVVGVDWPHIEVQLPMRMRQVDVENLILATHGLCRDAECEAVCCVPDFCAENKPIGQSVMASTLARLLFRHGLGCLCVPIATTDEDLQQRRAYFMGGVELWALGFFPFNDEPQGIMRPDHARQMLKEFRRAGRILRAFCGDAYFDRQREWALHRYLAQWVNENI